MRKDHLTGCVAALSLGLAGAVAAQAPELDIVEVRSIPVSFNMQAAHTPDGAYTLFHRIRQAADQMCRTSSYPVGHDRWVQHACEADAVNQAVQDLSIPALDDMLGLPADAEQLNER